MTPMRLLLVLLFPLACDAATTGREIVGPVIRDRLQPLPPGAVKLAGHLGAQIDLCVAHRIAAQNVDELLVAFRERKDVTEWRSEFWGKWITSAIEAWRYTGDESLRAKIQLAVDGLGATQTSDGYIGAYPDGGHLQRWDVWGRKYTLLGLLAWHELSGDATALNVARRQADFLLSEVGPGRASPFTNDMWSGMASSSVLEPMVLLYRRTGEPRYLEFAKYLVDSWSHPDGPDLLAKALAGTDVFSMFGKPDPKQTGYMAGGSSKAYEMMSCYEGLAELYRTTGQVDFRDAVDKVSANIQSTEITIAGSGSDWERWCDGRRRETEPWLHGMETCVSVTWLKLCAQQLRRTGDAAWSDQIERTLYNALLGAQKPDGSWWCHYTPLAGIRERAPEQCGMQQNCCVANGPRGLLLIPQLAVMQGLKGLVLNFYAPLQVKAELPEGGHVELIEQTDYPAGDRIEIVVNPDAPRSFALGLRIPAWSEISLLTVNGVAAPAPRPGSFAELARRWERGDVVVLQLDLRLRAVRPANGARFVAFERGPLVLARDERLGAGKVDEPVRFPTGISAKPAANHPAGIWQVFSMRLDAREGAGASKLTLCDFASAGNTWNTDSRYRVWLPLAD